MDLVAELANPVADVVNLFLAGMRPHRNNHGDCFPSKSNQPTFSSGLALQVSLLLWTSSTSIPWSQAPKGAHKRVGVNAGHQAHSIDREEEAMQENCRQ